MGKTTFIIAEIGTSHCASLEKAKALVDAAKKSGASAVKFQIVYADEILHPKTGFVRLPTGNIPLYERFKELEVPLSFYEELRAYSYEKGLLFGASPFGLKSLEELCRLNPDFIKIASPELNHYPLLEAVSKINIPVILSSGVSLLGDIEKALFYFQDRKDTISLLHCITQYPAPEDEYNLSLLPSLKNIFGVRVGVSDHSLDPLLVPVLSYLQGAEIIEKHICLDKTEEGLDDPVALSPNEFKTMVDAIRMAEKAPKKMYKKCIKSYGKAYVKAVLGTGEKKLAASEKAAYTKTNRSLHYMRDMEKGEIIQEKDISILRTEKILTVGESPEFLPLFLGSTLQTKVISGEGALIEQLIAKGNHEK